MPGRSVIVVGAGLAGLTAALDLANGGWQVTLLERRPFAGGRTFSFPAEDGEPLDNGQHLFLGCCSAYVALLHRLGQWHQARLQPTLQLRIVDSELGSAWLREAPLPAPLHLVASLLRLPYLSPREKAAVLPALALIRTRALPEDETFAAWLARHGQSTNAVARLWNLIVVPTCNAPAELVSASMGGFVFREGLLLRAAGGRIGWSQVGLSELVPEAALRQLRPRGARLRFGLGVERVELKSGRARALIGTAGEQLSADRYVLALPPAELRRVLPQPWTEPAGQLRSAPIVGISLWYDQPLFDGELLAAIVRGQALWLFNRSRLLRQNTADHHIAVSISAAEAWMEVPKAELAKRVAGLLAQLLPATPVEDDTPVSAASALTAIAAGLAAMIIHTALDG
ncbi:MAG: hydroxysqualene dehydroxylase HpnE, partial [Chloroflexota bacterium]